MTSGPRSRRQRIDCADDFVDRWILDRLESVIADCRAAYQAYEFHKVYHTLNQFCAVDLSSLYIDITKDRMYCDAPDSPRRRATQSGDASHFRRALPAARADHGLYGRGSVELSRTRRTRSICNCFPSRMQTGRNPTVENQVAQLLNLRGVIGQAVERARQEKLIGNALEAAVVLHCDQEAISAIPNEQLEEFFILSELENRAGQRAGRVDLEDNPCKMRALLAASTHRREERGASGIVRSV